MGSQPVLRTLFGQQGQVMIVTGVKAGIGFECTKHFLRMRPTKLVLAVCLLEKGQATALCMIDQTKEAKW